MILCTYNSIVTVCLFSLTPCVNERRLVCFLDMQQTTTESNVSSCYVSLKSITDVSNIEELIECWILDYKIKFHSEYVYIFIYNVSTLFFCLVLPLFLSPTNTSKLKNHVFNYFKKCQVTKTAVALL